MLKSQHRGRHENSCLFAIEGSFECSADGDFGFAEAHIATHEPVHRSFALHVGFDFLRGFQLVGCIFVEETRF